MSWPRGLILLFPQNVLLVAGSSSLGFVALANWACVCSVQGCSKTTQFN